MRDTRRTRAISPPPRARSYTAVKAEWEAVIARWARVVLHPVTEPARMRFVWIEPDAHRDPDGIAAGGRKLLLDGFVRAGILPDDSHRWVYSFCDSFTVASEGAPSGVWVTLFDRDPAVFFPHRLPDLNELLALRESSARRSVKSSLRGRLA
jgi:hypothetical protein